MEMEQLEDTEPTHVPEKEEEEIVEE